MAVWAHWWCRREDAGDVVSCGAVLLPPSPPPWPMPPPPSPLLLLLMMMMAVVWQVVEQSVVRLCDARYLAGYVYANDGPALLLSLLLL